MLLAEAGRADEARARVDANLRAFPRDPEISATDASKRFADLLDAVEHRGETSGAAAWSPARRGTGADLRRILGEHPPDDAWREDVLDLRRFTGDAPAADPWND